jgi:hypothetical protein
MDCHQAQDAILDSCDADGTGLPTSVDAHVSGCRECARFAARQRLLDTRLTKALAASALSPSFRGDLRRTLHRDARWFSSDRLPDIVHFASCGGATLCCAVFLPFDAAVTVGVGTTGALLSYIALTTVRSSFEDLEQPQR